MPGYMSWKELYKVEYQTLQEEGYGVEGCFPPGSAMETESEWERAYYQLVKTREKGLKPDCPYDEPDDFKTILEKAGRDFPALNPLSDKEYAERIKGAWFGRCAGVILGKPLEISVNRKDIREYLEHMKAYPLNDWVPDHDGSWRFKLNGNAAASCKGAVTHVQSDDDINYTTLALLLAENKGLSFTKLDTCLNWMANMPYNELFSATKIAYHHMVNRTYDRPIEDQIEEFPTKMNPMREGINGVIRTDFWGYIAPAHPLQAAGLAFKEASVNMTKNGIYGCLFVAAALSAALSKKPSLRSILQAAFAVLPQKSRLFEALNNVKAWYAEKKDWVSTCDRIYEKYGHLPFAGGINNLCFVLLALLHGRMDFTKTITIAVMCGTDTDCNGGTAGSIVGAALGFKGIESRWVRPFKDTVRTSVAHFGNGRITELVKRTIRVHQKHRDELNRDMK